MLGWYCRQLLALWIVMILVGGCTESTPEPPPVYWPTDGWRISSPEQQGMENVFHMIEVERYGLLQWSGSLGLKGFWQDDKTFVVQEHVLGQADSLEYRYTFIEDRVSIRLQEFVEDGSLYMSGELQK
jgi:hypothetical protein